LTEPTTTSFSSTISRLAEPTSTEIRRPVGETPVRHTTPPGAVRLIASKTSVDTPVAGGPQASRPGAERLSATAGCRARQLMVSSRLRHASSQARQASAQMRQCSCISACSAHSSPHALHAVAHAWSNVRLMFASYPVCRDSTRAVAAQMSAQSRSVRMHLVRSATLDSLRHASAHAVHA
jgi:hypothetical protein